MSHEHFSLEWAKANWHRELLNGDLVCKCTDCNNPMPINRLRAWRFEPRLPICPHCAKKKGFILCTECGWLCRKDLAKGDICLACAESTPTRPSLTKVQPEPQSYSSDLPCGICGEHKEKYTTIKQTLCDHLPEVKHNKICYDCYGTKIYFAPSKHRYEMGVDLKEAEQCPCCDQYRRKTKFVELQATSHNMDLFYRLTGISYLDTKKICKWCYEEKVLHCDDCHSDFDKTIQASRSDDKIQCIHCWSKEQKAPSITTPKSNKEKEPTTMAQTGLNVERIMGGAIGPDTSGKFKASLMGIAIRNNEGVYCIYDGEQMVDVMDFIMPGFGDVFRIPTAEVKVGDLILHQGEAQYVREVSDDGSIEVLNPFTSKIERLLPTKNLLGFKFYVKIISMTDMLGFGSKVDSENPFGNIGQMLLMSSLFGGNNGNSMGSMFGGSESNSPFGGMMGMLMMSQLFGGNQDNTTNPLANLFSGLNPTSKKATTGRGKGKDKDKPTEVKEETAPEAEK